SPRRVAWLRRGRELDHAGAPLRIDLGRPPGRWARFGAVDLGVRDGARGAGTDQPGGKGGTGLSGETPKELLALWSFRLVAWLARTLPEGAGRRAFDAFGRLAFRLLPGVRATVAANQALVRPRGVGHEGGVLALCAVLVRHVSGPGPAHRRAECTHDHGGDRPHRPGPRRWQGVHHGPAAHGELGRCRAMAGGPRLSDRLRGRGAPPEEAVRAV